MRTFALTSLVAPTLGMAALLGLSSLPAPAAAEARAATTGPGAAGAAIESPAVAADEHGATFGAIIREALREVEALREELAAVRRRNLELETRHAEDLMTIGVLRATLTSLRAEADRLHGELEASWRWIEELNTTLTQVRADLEATGGGPRTIAARSDGGRPPSEEEEPRAAALAAAGGERERLGSEGDPLTGGADGDTLGADGGGDEAYHAAAAVAVNLRQRPANASDVVAVVHKGHTVEVIGYDKGWLQVEYTDPRSRDDLIGWIYGRFLHRTDAPQAHADASLTQGGS